MPLGIVIGLPKPGLWQVCFFQDIQDDSWGPATIRVDGQLNVSVAELGITGDGQNLVINSDTNIPVNFNFTGQLWNPNGGQKVNDDFN